MESVMEPPTIAASLVPEFSHPQVAGPLRLLICTLDQGRGDIVIKEHVYCTRPVKLRKLSAPSCHWPTASMEVFWKALMHSLWRSPCLIMKISKTCQNTTMARYCHHNSHKINQWYQRKTLSLSIPSRYLDSPTSQPCVTVSVKRNAWSKKRQDEKRERVAATAWNQAEEWRCTRIRQSI